MPDIQAAASAVIPAPPPVVSMRVFGNTRRFRASISEPEPGRRLLGTDAASGSATSFLVEPVDREGSSRVTIATRRVYAVEVALLADHAAGAR